MVKITHAEDAIKERLQREKVMLKTFNSAVKTIEHIVFLAYGDESIDDRGINVPAGNFSILFYYLWKIFEARDKTIHTGAYNAARMFLFPVMQGSWETEGMGAQSFLDARYNAFEHCVKGTYETVEDLHADVYLHLNGITREHPTDKFLPIALNRNLSDESDQSITLKILTKSLKGEMANENLLTLVIVTTYVCRAIGKDEITYCDGMSILFRLALILSGREFIVDMDKAACSRTKSIDKAVEEYLSLPEAQKRTIEEEMRFLFNYSASEKSISLLPIERELFRITQQLFRISNVKQDIENEKNSKVNIFITMETDKAEDEDLSLEIADVVKKLFNTSVHKKDYKLGFDEENFYCLLARRNRVK